MAKAGIECKSAALETNVLTTWPTMLSLRKEPVCLASIFTM